MSQRGFLEAQVSKDLLTEWDSPHIIDGLRFVFVFLDKPSGGSIGSSASGRGRNSMKKSESKVYKELLLAMRSRLRGDVNAMADAALTKTRAEASGDLSLMPIHMADVGTDNYEQEFTLALMQNEEGVLGLVESALERIEDGEYGTCQECQGRIPKTRLSAIPYTAYCIKCASKLEND
jgi:RNA polymerase-binding transcription factor DksA